MNIMKIEKDSITHAYKIMTSDDMVSVHDVNHMLELVAMQKYPNRTGDDDFDSYVCPTCNHELITLEEIGFVDTPNYCPNCGQALEWKQAYERGYIAKADE